MKKASFQTNFKPLSGTHTHIFYITVFAISCRCHTYQKFELHYSESRDFEQNVRYNCTHR